MQYNKPPFDIANDIRTLNLKKNSLYILRSRDSDCFDSSPFSKVSWSTKKHREERKSKAI